MSYSFSFADPPWTSRAVVVVVRHHVPIRRYGHHSDSLLSRIQHSQHMCWLMQQDQRAPQELVQPVLSVEGWGGTTLVKTLALPCRSPTHMGGDATARQHPPVSRQALWSLGHRRLHA